MAVSRNRRNSIEKYLAGDADYQNAVNALTKNYEDLSVQTQSQRRDLTEDFNTTNQRLKAQKGTDLGSLQEDLAARGLFGSGISVKKENDFNTGYQNQFNDAATSNRRKQAELINNRRNAQTLMQQARNQARLDAIRRRSAKLGIG